MQRCMAAHFRCPYAVDILTHSEFNGRVYVNDVPLKAWNILSMYTVDESPSHPIGETQISNSNRSRVT